jgi:hypothetical protein
MSEEEKVEKTQVHILRDAFEGMKGRQLKERALLSWRGVAVLATSLATVGLGSVPIQVAHADQIYVDCKVDKLINAISSAANRDFLSLTPGCIYTLTDVYPSDPTQPFANVGKNGLPVITKTLTIKGNGATITRQTSAVAKFRIFLVAQGGDLTISDLTVDNGDTSGTGTDPKAGRGGGILNLGSLKVTNSTFSHNNGSFGSGGIGNGIPLEIGLPPVAGNLTLSDSVFFDNSGGTGGAIGNGATSTMNLTRCTISHNTTSSEAGGIANQGTAILNKCTVSGNSAGFGGGIVSAGQLFLTDSRVTGNSAIGCVNSATGCDPTITGFGGGIVNLGGQLFLTDSPVTGNTATNGGGILSVGQLFLTDNAVTGNSATAVTGNSATGFGGGILNRPDSAATLTNSDVTGNSATSDGAGIANFGHMTLTHSNITGNDAMGNGGGIANEQLMGASAAILTLTDGDVTDNKAGQGGGIFNQTNNTVTLNHSTIVANTPNDCSGC